MDIIHQSSSYALKVSKISLYMDSYLVPQPLACNNGDLITNAFVCLKVEGELGVVALNDDLGRLFDRLCPYATHCGGCWFWKTSLNYVSTGEISNLKIAKGLTVCGLMPSPPNF